MAQKCLSFDGTDNYVTLPSGMFPNNNYSYECWIKTAVGNPHKQIISARDDVFSSLYLYANKVYFGVSIGTVFTNIISNDTVTNNAWHYIAVTKSSIDGTKMYVDGVLQDDVNTGLTGNVDAETTTSYLGIYDGLTRDYTGLIDEVRISDKVRSQAEITAAWNGGDGLRFVVDSDTVALWHIDEGADATIFDETDNDYDGTITGASWTDGFDFSKTYELSCTDGLVGGDTTPNQGVFISTATDGIVSGDASLRTVTIPVLATDGLTSGDTPLTQAIFGVLATDGIKFGDIPSYLLKSIRRLKDFTGRALSTITGRSLSDGDETRELK